MPNLKLICVFLIPLIYVLHGQTPGFITEPSDIEVKAGEDVNLQCVFNGDASNCYWSRNDGEVVIGESRYTYSLNNLLGGDCSIKITNSNFENDNGIWNCGLKQTSESTGIKSRSIKLSVLITPDDPYLELDDQSVANGSEVVLSMENSDISPASKLKCISQGGNPPPTIIWRLQDMGTVQSLNTVSSSDNKTYMVVSEMTTTADVTWQGKRLDCVVTHGSYEGERIVTGIVRVPHDTQTVVLSTFTGLSAVDADNGEDVTLVCTPDGHPPPAIKYEKKTDSSDWVEFFPIVSGNNFTFPAFSGQVLCQASMGDGQTPVDSNIISITTPTTASAGMSTGAIVGIVIAVLLIVGAAVGIFVCYKKEIAFFKPKEHIQVPTTEPNYQYRKETPQKMDNADPVNMKNIELGENEHH